jgi:hypothetical protein
MGESITPMSEYSEFVGNLIKLQSGIGKKQEIKSKHYVYM